MLKFAIKREPTRNFQKTCLQKCIGIHLVEMFYDMIDLQEN
jgi:hypothetical protein